ncbi:MAG TPA: PIN domain-containing protein [Solirubrobacteraceae bacterium]|nr:PIN domain-containing protein [Solirubrobacteraceae bacterium]
MTADRAFVDTNVLVYASDEDEPSKRATARQLLASFAPGDLVISTQVLVEFYVTVTRKLARALPPEGAAARVRDLARMPTVLTDVALVHAAVDTSRSVTISLWDALIVEAARVGGCNRLITEDLAGGATIRGVRIENPFA